MQNFNFEGKGAAMDCRVRDLIQRNNREKNDGSGKARGKPRNYRPTERKGELFGQGSGQYRIRHGLPEGQNLKLD
jgi:hypothetical protein